MKYRAFHCEHCGKEFRRGMVAYRRNRHCSYACKAASMRKIRPEELREAVLSAMTLEQMARKFSSQRDTVKKWLERDGLMEQWKQLRVSSHEHECAHCQTAFVPMANSVGRFCSLRCYALARTKKIERTDLLPMVEAGLTLLSMAAALKCNRNVLKDLLVREDLYRLWSSRRYKKCASPKAGSSSVPTASSATTSLSAATALLMAGGTSCGG